MEQGKKCRERSVRIRSDNTSSSLRAGIPFLPRLPPFIGYEGSRSALKSYLPYLTTSDIPMYLTLLYVQVRACVREEPVPTHWCTDSACGRFSSRQRYTNSSLSINLNTCRRSQHKVLDCAIPSFLCALVSIYISDIFVHINEGSISKVYSKR